MSSNEIEALLKQGSPHNWQISNENSDWRYAQFFSNSVLTQLHGYIMQEQAQVIQNH
jgi:hypothetical protein